MTVKDEDLPALHELESTVVDCWSKHELLNDYNVGRAYESTFQHYRACQRGHPPKPPGLSGLDLEAFNAVREICEQLFASGAGPLPGKPKRDPMPVPLEKLVVYLRELSRSVERHTKQGGRCGYLEFASKFVA